MKRLVITVEYSDGRPSKSSRELDIDEVTGHVRDYAMQLAMTREYVGIYITRADCLQFLPTGASDDTC